METSLYGIYEGSLLGPRVSIYPFLVPEKASQDRVDRQVFEHRILVSYVSKHFPVGPIVFQGRFLSGGENGRFRRFGARILPLPIYWTPMISDRSFGATQVGVSNGRSDRDFGLVLGDSRLAARRD